MANAPTRERSNRTRLNGVASQVSMRPRSSSLRIRPVAAASPHTATTTVSQDRPFHQRYPATVSGRSGNGTR